MTEPFLKPGLWYDPDQAACALAITLGLYDSGSSTFGPAKWVFAVRNPVGDAINGLLAALVDKNILVENEEGQLSISPGYNQYQFGEWCCG